MNLAHHPDLLDRIAAAVALGTLRGGARRRFETLARRHAVVHAAALTWSARLAGLTELQPGVEPDPAVWTRIENLIRADAEQRAMQAARGDGAAATAVSGGGAPGTGWRSLLLWRTIAIGGVLAAVFAVQNAGEMRDQYRQRVAELQQQLQSAPLIEYVAVLADEKSDASMLVTFDPKNRRLVLKRVSRFDVAGDKSLQLWALPPGAAPRSLGVLDSNEPVQRIQASESEVGGVPALAISLEPFGGVPSERGPTGPWLFKGPLLQTVL